MSHPAGEHASAPPAPSVVQRWAPSRSGRSPRPSSAGRGRWIARSRPSRPFCSSIRLSSTSGGGSPSPRRFPPPCWPWRVSWPSSCSRRPSSRSAPPARRGTPRALAPLALRVFFPSAGCSLRPGRRGVGGRGGPLARRLGEKFVLRYFRFAADAGPLAGAGGLRGAGTRTDLAGALDAARQDLAGVPLAGLVLVTDGADNAGTDLTPALLALRGRRVPVYTVGVGRERFARDLAIEQVALPASALGGAGMLAEVVLRVRGLGGQTATVTAEDEGRVVARREMKLPDAAGGAGLPLRLPPLPEGSRRLTFKVRPAPGEIVTENNEYRTVLRVRPGPEKVLYLEGEPRPDFAFIRRAVTPDSAIQLVALLRSAKGKFLRLGVDDSLELVEGFPTRREDLFRYRAIVLGDIEASFFTGDQLRMLADFVSRRGGGLLALGGRGALAEGGFAGTPLAEVLPVSLGAPADSAGSAVELTVSATPAGRVHAALQLGPTEEAATRWDSLPPLTSVNRLGALKPGATALLVGRPTGSGQPQVPVLATQRFGRGTAAVLGVQDTWLWQMDASIPVEDQTHQTLWRPLP